jgi:phage terminase large subunit
MDKLTGIRRDRLRDGKWVRAEGVVYDEFEPKVHVVDPMQVSGRYLAAVDWGFTNPGIIQVWFVDGDGRLYLVEEIYQTGQLVSWWVAQAKRLQAQYGIETFVCDPAQPGNIEEFRAANLIATGADNQIALGIQKVKDRLRAAGDGRPRLFLCRGATRDLDQTLVSAYKPSSTEQEFGSYVWPQGVDGKPVKENPVDEHNHGLDALRYMVMYLDGNIVETMTMAQFLAKRGSR